MLCHQPTHFLLEDVHEQSVVPALPRAAYGQHLPRMPIYVSARTSSRQMLTISTWLEASDTRVAFGARDNDILKETAFK